MPPEYDSTRSSIAVADVDQADHLAHPAGDVGRTSARRAGPAVRGARARSACRRCEESCRADADSQADLIGLRRRRRTRPRVAGPEVGRQQACTASSSSWTSRHRSGRGTRRSRPLRSRGRLRRRLRCRIEGLAEIGGVDCSGHKVPIVRRQQSQTVDVGPDQNARPSADSRTRFDPRFVGPFPRIDGRVTRGRVGPRRRRRGRRPGRR